MGHTRFAMEQGEHSWSDRRSTTLKDVAKSVGVSESTVSVILNQTRSGTRVSAATRRIVLEAAERLGYRPNALARSLLTGRTQRIGVYSGRLRLDSRNLFCAELLGGMLESSGMHGCNLVVHTTGEDPENLLDLVSNRALDGLIVHARQDDPIIPVLDQLRVPAVAVVDRVEKLPSICVDDVGGGLLQAKHLASLGHRRVIYQQGAMDAGSARSRMEGFIDSADSLGIEVSLHIEERDQKGLTPLEIELLTRPQDRFTAIVAWNDYTAEQVCKAVSDLGIPPGDQLAVLGFDGMQSSYEPRFKLTTVLAPWSRVGNRAVETLMALLAGESVPPVQLIPVEFIRGQTS